MIHLLDEKVKTILRDGEKLLNFYVSQKAKSSYFIIIRSENEFITFRVSNHPTSAFYSNRTFDSRKDLDLLLKDIRAYMDKSSWYVFKYEDYFSLKALSQIPFKRIQFYIDNSMGIFDYFLGGLVFYQSRKFGRNHKEFNIVSESFQAELRKLFSVGLISEYRKDKDNILVYINRSSRFMMTYMEERYLDQFKKDEKEIDYRYIELPEARCSS
ncbi:hypothetical protein ACKQTC_04105 [Peptococcus simiae]|uniref:Uncharacterized protein n=1 Tax=Peptococcus simiae TaxID=1643805 RepID=A0ABW9H072_9FIRM